MRCDDVASRNELDWMFRYLLLTVEQKNNFFERSMEKLFWCLRAKFSWKHCVKHGTTWKNIEENVIEYRMKHWGTLKSIRKTFISTLKHQKSPPESQCCTNCLEMDIKAWRFMVNVFFLMMSCRCISSTEIVVRFSVWASTKEFDLTVNIFSSFFCRLFFEFKEPKEIKHFFWFLCFSKPPSLVSKLL